MVEMDRTRRLMADHMVMSKQVSPHVTSYIEVDMSPIVQWRDKVKDDFIKREKQKITFTAIIVEATAQALHEFDARLPEFMAKLRPGDLAVVTADHGCDPTWAGSDHTREHIPMLFFGLGVEGRALPISSSFSDIGQTLASHLGVSPLLHGHRVL